MDLVQDIQKLMEELTGSIKLLRRHGNDLANAEKNYKVKLRQEALKLRSEENMPVTLINQIIYGIDEVAELRLKRDIAQTMYDTNLEHINVTKLKLRLLEAQLNREWTNDNGR
jgi:hypothetical protein